MQHKKEPNLKIQSCKALSSRPARVGPTLIEQTLKITCHPPRFGVFFPVAAPKRDYYLLT